MRAGNWVWALAAGAVACSSESAGPTDVGSVPDLAALLDQGVPTDAGFRPDASGLDASASDQGSADQGVTCTYPSGAVEPMALGEILSPYRWPTALDRAGNAIDLDLSKVFCNDDEDIDWSPFDVLLFVSIPAW